MVRGLFVRVFSRTKCCDCKVIVSPNLACLDFSIVFFDMC